MDGTIIPVVGSVMLFGSIAAIVILPAYFRERTKQSAHRLVAEAIAKGQSVDPALVQKLTENVITKQQSNPRRTLGSAIVMLALAGGFLAAGYSTGGDWIGDGNWGFIPAAILGALGAAFLILAIVDYMSQKNKKTEQ
ncbi:MAG: hypothetical protein ABUS57_02470 [Pseudomonadota bacterium]